MIDSQSARRYGNDKSGAKVWDIVRPVECALELDGSPTGKERRETLYIYGCRDIALVVYEMPKGYLRVVAAFLKLTKPYSVVRSGGQNEG